VDTFFFEKVIKMGITDECIAGIPNRPFLLSFEEPISKGLEKKENHPKNECVRIRNSVLHSNYLNIIPHNLKRRDRNYKQRK